MCEVCISTATSETLATARAAVERGAEHLDIVAYGWRRKVDLSILDIDDVTKCIVGQVFDDKDKYVSGYHYWRKTYKPWQFGFESADLGFCSGTVNGESLSSSVLGNAWREYFSNNS